MTQTYTIDLHLKSLTNSREHWAAKAKRAKAHRQIGAQACGGWSQLPCAVTFTRIAPRPLDDDNLRESFKSIRDGFAKRLSENRGERVDDSDPRIEWRYSQERRAVKEYSVMVTTEGK